MRHLSIFMTTVTLSAAIACGDDTDVITPPPSTGSGGSGGDQGGAPTCDQVAVGEVDGGSWDTRFTLAGLSGHDGIAPAVHDFALAPDGSVLAAGRFQWFEGAPVTPLLRWSNGRWSPAIERWDIAPPLDGFSAVAVGPGSELALATNDSFGEREGEIWIDDGSGLRSIGAFTGQVRSLAWFEGRLWVAGLFELDAPAPPIAGLATWDDGWSAPPGGAITGYAFELALDESSLLVGGAFSSIGGLNAANVASFDGVTWTAFDFPDAVVIYALARSARGDLYAGGAYGDFYTASGLARWDGNAWQTVGGGLAQYETRGVVTDLVAHDNVVDATGCFTNAGGLPDAPGAIVSRSVARWDGGAWQTLDDDPVGAIAPWIQWLVCGDEGLTAIWDVPYQRLAHDGAQLFAGGWFAGIDGVASQALAAHDGTSWLAQGSAELGINGSLDRVAAGGDSCELYGVGKFTHIAGEPNLGGVVRFNGDAWEVLDDPLPQDAWCPAIDVSPAGELAVGCLVFSSEGTAEGTILQVKDGALVEATAPRLPPVMAIDWSRDGALWIAGGESSGYLARLRGDELTMIENGFDGIVGQLDAASEDDIVVAGMFAHVGAVEASRIARWDGTSWSALGDGLPGQPSALARDATTIYVSTYDEGSGAFLLGAFDGQAWRELATPGVGITPLPEFNFNGIHPIEGGLIVSGSAALDEDASARGVFVYRDGAFESLAGGVGAIGVGNVAVSGRALWVAGLIAQAGPSDARVSSAGVARYALP